ncbi:alanyl-tRNA editing protein [Phanerochaete sordida]|uniref:Alanyl-tRNA editing protein n=1 Tax=Phanerochaete sordida TaxID=48140 RepID=A0A9P3FYK6_9APHY|nr:alanyl-tRNA editing protein [Phanerochaete sordida]
MAAAALVLPPVTPPDYHRIVSSTLSVPSDPQTTIPVGLLACQRDPLLRELATTVVSSRLAEAPPQPKRAKKDKSGAPPPPATPLLEVLLHDTVLFPEGGGQPSDIGLLTSADGHVWDVAEVKRIGGHAVHYVKVVEKTVEDALAVFTTGAKVHVQLGDAGLQRRLDHMCMHTSQHLLSAVLEQRYQLDTLSWSLTAYPTPSYVEIPRAMTPDEIAAVQDECNRYVFEGRRVHIEVQELDAEGKNYRTPSKAIPDDYTGGVKRTVVIDGLDRNPCCGTHAPSLHNLQLFLLPHTDTLARGSAASARLLFLAGPRLLAHLAAAHTHLAAAAATLSCGAPQVPARVAQVVDERRRAAKRAEDLELELAAHLARDLLASADGAALVRRRHRTDDGANALAFLGAVATVCAVEAGTRPHTVVLSSAPPAQTPASTTVVLVFGDDERRVKEVGDALKARLGVKGGGKGMRWSGKFTGVWKEAKEGAVVNEILGL